MKTRNGFVSNSSTSSFVLVGLYLDAKKYTREALDEMLEPHSLRVITHEDEEGFVPKGKFFVGEQLMRIDDDGPPRDVSLTDALETISKLREILGDPAAELPATLVGTVMMS
jgi:hypothetical protein